MTSTADKMTSNYKVQFVPYTHLDSTKHTAEQRNRFLRLCAWVDKHHGNGSQQFRSNMLVANQMDKNFMARMMTSSLLEVCFWVVLTDNDKVVCVANYEKGMTIETLTTATDERKKGHATYLMSYLRTLFESKGIPVICPAKSELLSMLTKAGWTKHDETLNPDRTYDTMPDFVKPIYREQTYGRRGKRPLLENHGDEVIAFLESLPLTTAPAV